MAELDTTAAGESTQDVSGPRDGDDRNDALAAAIDQLMPEEDEDDEGDQFVAAPKERRASPDEELDTGRKVRASDDEDEEEEEPEEDEEEGDEDERAEAEGEEGEEAEDEADIALHRAYTVLHASGVPAGVLKRTPKAQLIAWAESVEAKRAESAANANGNGESGRNAEAGNDQGSSTSARTSEPTWETERAQLAERLGVDVEQADAFKPWFDRQVSLEKRLADMDRAAAEREGRRNINAELRRLREPYPELGENSKKRDKVIDAALTLVAGLQKRGADVDVEKVFDQAARMTLGAPKRGDLARLRRNGMSTQPYGNRGGLGVERSEVEFWDKAIAFSEQGKPDLIKRMRIPGGMTRKPAERFAERRR